MGHDWIKKLSQEQLDQMLAEIQQEAEMRKDAKKAQAWEKVKTAIKEYLAIAPIEIGTPEDSVYMDKDTTIKMDVPGFIDVTPW